MVTPIQPKANQKMIFFGIGILVGVLITLIGIKYITVKTPVSTTPS
jgi:hypothetical protein